MVKTSSLLFVNMFIRILNNNLFVKTLRIDVLFKKYVKFSELIISLDILRAVVICKSLILSNSDFDDPGKGTCLCCSPNCP
jgi:hypothetical protein